MMSIHIRRRFISLISEKSFSFLCEPRVCLPVYFSTCKSKQPRSNPNFSESLMEKYHFHPQAASHLASVLTSLKNPQKSDTILSFFVESGFSATQLEKILKSYHRLLSMNLNKIIKPKIKIFQDFGFSASEIVEIISKDPSILHSSADKRVIPSLSVLKGLLGSTAKVAEILKISGLYLRSDLDNTLLPNINLLTSCGVAMDKIFWLMYYFPRFLLQNTENLKRFVDKVDEMGVSRSSKRFIHGVRIISSMTENNWEQKLRIFRDLGFSDENIKAAFRNVPLVFGVSEEKIKEVKELLLGTGKYEMTCIVNNPVSFMYSVEKRYKPRLKVLEVLESKNVIESWPCFATLCRMSEKKFYDKFVGPYLDEVGHLYMAKSVISGNKYYVPRE